MVGKYRKKPVVIEAIRWVGFNTPNVAHFMGATQFVEHRSYRIHNIEEENE